MVLLVFFLFCGNVKNRDEGLDKCNELPITWIETYVGIGFDPSSCEMEHGAYF